MTSRIERELFLKPISDKLSDIDNDINELEDLISLNKNKLYILKVLGLTQDIRSIYCKNPEEYREADIKITKYYDWDFGWILRTGVRLSDRYQYHNPTSEVKSIFQRLESIKIYDPTYVSSRLEPNVEYVFKFSEYDNLRSLLLNEDILKKINYLILLGQLKLSKNYDNIVKI